jgi:hypothetical protein
VFRRVRVQRFVSLALVLLVASLAACDNADDSPTAPPGGGNVPPVTNAAPVISAIAVDVADRVEVNQDIDVTAAVTDAETPTASLQFIWTANAGTFTGSGPSVKWRLTKGSVATPVDVTISLEVVESYADVDSRGQPITSTNRVKKTAAPFRAHDSVAELSDMTIRFLVDYFGHSDVDADACLVDFWDDCPGRAAEHSDIENNREMLTIQSAEAHVDSVTFDDEDNADIVAPCRFEDTLKSTGKSGVTRGNCLLTGVYHDGRWWLCDSSFDPGDDGGRFCNDGTDDCNTPEGVGSKRSFMLPR